MRCQSLVPAELGQRDSQERQQETVPAVPVHAHDAYTSWWHAEAARSGPAPSAGGARGLEGMAALELLGDCAAAEAAAAKRAKGVDSLNVRTSLPAIFSDADALVSLYCIGFQIRIRPENAPGMKGIWMCQVRDMLRASIKEAAAAATRGAASAASASAGAGGSGATAGSPQRGSALLWALLRNCLRQHGEALIDLAAARSVAKDAQADAAQARAGIASSPCMSARLERALRSWLRGKRSAIAPSSCPHPLMRGPHP